MCRQCITQLSVSSRVNFCWLASLPDRFGVMQHGKTGACLVSTMTDTRRHSCQTTLVAPQMLRRCASGILSVPQLRRRLCESAQSSRQNGHPAYAVKGREEGNRRLDSTRFLEDNRSASAMAKTFWQAWQYSARKAC